MQPYYERSGIRLYHGDCREVVPSLGEQFAAVVTDPPYGLSFMGRDWDHAVPGVAFWEAFKDAMLPGAHLLAFGGSRTYHRIAVAIEDAGFEIRDTLQWLYGSGFPKSHDVSKAIDKAAGAEREVVGESPYNARRPNPPASERYKQAGHKANITAPATPEAEQWQGWGTALKPAYEPIILARKPLSGTVAANVLQHGTGALNIDASRIGTDGGTKAVDFNGPRGNGVYGKGEGSYRNGIQDIAAGRWPSNVLLDETAAAQLDRQSGERKGRVGMTQHSSGTNSVYGTYARSDQSLVTDGYPDTGGASRFFYVAKASRRERNAGLEGLPERTKRILNGGITSADHPETASGGGDRQAQNHHPTVKPLALMRWLLTLVTPPGGVVLDPFAGSGTTGVAAAALGIPCVLIEQEAEYLPIIAGRIDHALDARAGAELPLFAGVAD